MLAKAAIPATKPRTKVYKPKSRTGCKTCKIRRIKCDETKPHCRRCTTTGRTCDGYDVGISPLRTSPREKTPSASQSLPPPIEAVVDFAVETLSLHAPPLLLPLLRLESDEERISLQFYVKHAGPALAKSSNSAFWQRQVLQAAHQYASVQHCIIALGAMYRRFFEATPSHIDKNLAGQRYQFALNQSNKAIQQLIQDQAKISKIGAADKLTAMTCCVLFGSMANLERQHNASLSHLRSGIRMLRETKLQSYNERDSHPVNINSLRSIFTGLDIQARSSMNWLDVQSWEPVIPSMRASEPVDIDTNSPWALSELHCRIETLLNDTLAFNRGCVIRPFTDRDTIQLEHNALATRFQHIIRTLDTLRALNPRIDAPQSNSSKTMLLLAQTQHWLRSSIAPLRQHFDVSSPLATLPFDAAQHFTDMMPHIEDLLSLTPPSVPVYSAAPGPLSALWLIGTSAPTECVALRRKALELMLKHPRREGLFEGRLMGKVGMVAWGLEQGAARREIGMGEYGDGVEDLVVPEHLRFVFLDVEFATDDERRARVKLANAVDLRSGGGTVVTIDY
ncbi:C6 zinc finger protein [Stagonosporopsis vannaccii]|nr:C6 zinc finger protein [Stagonosporopsis vannaccii]